MAFTNPYYPPQQYTSQYTPQQYSPYTSPYSPPVSTPAPQMQNNMLWVQGENGAKAYLVAANNTVPLWDSEQQTIYLKTVDMNGVPSMRILDYTERTAAPRTPVAASQPVGVEYVTRDDFDKLAALVDSLRTKETEVTE